MVRFENSLACPHLYHYGNYPLMARGGFDPLNTNV